MSFFSTFLKSSVTGRSFTKAENGFLGRSLLTMLAMCVSIIFADSLAVLTGTLLVFVASLIYVFNDFIGLSHIWCFKIITIIVIT